MGIIQKAVGWLLNTGVNGLLNMVGNLCRFMTTECFESFLIFALIGCLVYIGGGTKVGMKMIRVSLVVFLIMQIVGVFCY